MKSALFKDAQRTTSLHLHDQCLLQKNVCVYLCVHQLCLYVCACRPILIVAMETECCQRSPDSKRASLSVSLCDSLSVFLPALLFHPSFFHLSGISPRSSSVLHSLSLSDFLLHSSPPSFLRLLVPLIIPPSFPSLPPLHPSWRVVCN